MTKNPNNTATKKDNLDLIFEALERSKENLSLASYLLRCGANIVFPGDLVGNHLIKTGREGTPEIVLIAEILSRAMETDLDNWEARIAMRILGGDTKTLQNWAQQLHTKNPACPYCRWMRGVRYRRTKQDYICAHCKKTWTI